MKLTTTVAAPMSRGTALTMALVTAAMLLTAWLSTTSSETPNAPAAQDRGAHDATAQDDDAGGDTADDASQNAAKETPPAGTKSVLILYGVNNYGFIDVCGCKRTKVRQGSVTRRASLFKQLALDNPQQIPVDGGNTVFGRRELHLKGPEIRQAIEKAKVVVESYNRMGYKAMTFGHFDLSLGIDAYREATANAKFPTVCANFIDKESGKLVFPPFAEVVVNDIKVGILGLTTSTLQPHFLASKAPGTQATDALEAAKKYVPELAARDDIVIVLSQNTDSDNHEIAKQVDGIDFLVDPAFNLGSNKIWIDKEDLTERVGDTLIVRCDAQGARIGSLNTWVHATRSSGGAAIARPFVDRAETTDDSTRTSFRFRRYMIEPHFGEDPEILKLVDAFRAGSKFVNTEALPPLPNKERYLTQATCQTCHPQQHDWWQKTQHAHAFAGLEKTGDQWRQDCIGCHVLGYGQAFYAPDDAEPYKNVQCESCHGLNPQHPTDPAKYKWPRIQESTCLTCHNKRQTFEDFNYHVSRRKVACPKIQR